MRTPDKTAGKRGQCPDCHTKVQIPLTSIATAANSTADPSASENETPTSAQTERQTRPIRLTCSKCRETLTVPAANAGKKGKCPHCGAVMTIPSAKTLDKGTLDKSQPPPRWKGASKATSPIQFNCPSCRQLVKVTAAAAGARGKCPHCQAVVQIPTKSTVQTSAAPPASATEGLTPQPDTGLTPPRDDPFADLPDLSPPPKQDPLARPASGSFGGGAGTNSYFEPSSAHKRRKIFKPRVNVSRNGLPWDKNLKPDGAFSKTTKLILFSPNKAFCMMKREGGIGRPLGFGYAGFVGGVMASVLYAAVIAGVVLGVSYFMFRAGGKEAANAGQVFTTYGIIVGIVVGGQLIQSSLFVVLGSFVNAGIHHLLLMMLEGANHPYETSYRATAYSMGACGAVLFVPVLGSIVFPFVYPVITILSLKNAHETSAGRAAFAVLLPYAILCGCYLGLLIFSNVFSTISAATQGS